MKKISNRILYLIGFVLALNIFTFATDKIQFSYLVFYVSILILLGLISLCENLKFGKELYVILGIKIFLLFKLFSTYDFQRSFRFTMFLMVFILICLILSKKNIWHQSFEKGIFIFSAIIVIGTFISFLFPNIYYSYLYPLFSSSSQITIDKIMRVGGQTGFTNQTSANGFLISLGISALFCRTLTIEKGKFKFKLFIVIYTLALLMTMKRSFIIANILSVVILSYLKMKVDKRRINKAFKGLSFAAIVVLIISFLEPFFPSVQNTILRFMVSDSENFTSGRNIIYSSGVKMFLDKPILGQGLDTVTPYLNQEFGIPGIQQMHNIYLQLLAEVGLIGFSIFIVLVTFLYVKTYKLTKYSYRFSDTNVKFLLSSSLYVQTLWLIYGLFGNPFTEHVFLLTYLIFVSISLYYRRIKGVS